MPSKKKARGKARKAIAKRKGEEEEEEVDVTQMQAQTQTELQQRQRDSNPNALEDPFAGLFVININKCTHGFAYTPEEVHLCKEYLNEQASVLQAASDFRVGIGIHIPGKTAKAEVAMMEKAASFLLCIGAWRILRGECDKAGLAAYFVTYLEYHIKAFRHFDRDRDLAPMCSDPNIVDDHTLVRFFQKRIPCACLDEKYEQVKSITKMGSCWNAECNLPDRKTARSKLLYCSRCKKANYCSQECQRADWKIHKRYCA